MLLRRVTQHVKTQNWFAVFLDFLIVVVGVFIGIQVSNQNTLRGERAQLNEQLLSLQTELVKNQSHFEQYKNELQQQMNEVNALRALFKTDVSAAEPDLIHAQLLNIQRVKIFAPDMTAFDELAETGGIRRLAGTDIRTAIDQWQQALSLVHRNYNDSLVQRDNVFNPFMMRHIAYGPLLEQSWMVGDSVEPSKFRNDLSELAESRELDNQMAFRYGIAGSTIHALESLQNETKNLIDVLNKGQTKS